MWWGTDHLILWWTDHFDLVGDGLIDHVVVDGSFDLVGDGSFVLVVVYGSFDLVVVDG